MVDIADLIFNVQRDDNPENEKGYTAQQFYKTDNKYVRTTIPINPRELQEVIWFKYRNGKPIYVRKPEVKTR